MTSALLVEVLNQESSPYFPGLYLEARKSLGKPHTAEMKCGRDWAEATPPPAPPPPPTTDVVAAVAESSNVEKPLRNAREINRDVQLSDCISSIFDCNEEFFQTKNL